jgi:hypothetical protein
LQLDEPNPSIETATGKRSDDLGNDDDDKSRKLNTVVRRQLQNISVLQPVDVERLMRADKFETVGDLIRSDADAIRSVASITQQTATSLFDLFNTDFRVVRA